MKKLWCFLFGHRLQPQKVYQPLWSIVTCDRCDAIILCERGGK
jgi:hypothetical protein